MARPKHKVAGRDDCVIRVPRALFDRIDVWAERKRVELEGFEITRADAIRALLILALKAEGVPDSPK